LPTKLSGCGWKLTVYVSVTRESCPLLCAYGLLAEHTSKAQADFAAGTLSNRDLIIILVCIAALILIIVGVR
jgi:hypothetical protein